MMPFDNLGLALVAITIMVALVLAIAWIDFGRPRHALTWSVGFGLMGIVWILGFTALRSGYEDRLLEFAVLTLGGTAIGLNTVGFRQRSGAVIAWSPVAAGIAAQAVTTAVLLWIGGVTVAVAALPLFTLSAVMAWNASRMLVGRRKGERAAERLAQYCLWTLAVISLALLATGGMALIGGPTATNFFLFTNLAPVLPATITGIGLFTLFLLTADLADQSRRLAGTDMLTGLLNRRGFEEAAQALLGSAERNGRTLCLAVVDIDHFKEVNDRYGHLAGDDVLRRFAACLAGEIGRRDILARVGGEEFAIILADRDESSSAALLERTRQAVERCVLELPDQHRVTASFGLAALDPNFDLPTMFAEADRALYAAKEAGRNRIVIASRPRA